jgi:hypothetical protein
LVAITETFAGQAQIVIGECKSAGGEITEADVENLVKVADAFENSLLEPFIVFSKVSWFSTAEIERCKKAQTKRRRTILLSNRELEPYFMYEKTARERSLNISGNSLEDQANSTEQIYFAPLISQSAL